jgi:hypothetical protein
MRATMATGQNVNLYHLELAAGKRASVIDRHESRFGAVAVQAFYLDPGPRGSQVLISGVLTRRC